VNIVIKSVDHAPDDLYGQLPVRGRLLRTIAKADRPGAFRTASGEYWLAELRRPLTWTSQGVTRTIRYLVVAPRWEGTSIQPGAKLPVGVAYVVDDGVLASGTFASAQAEYVAIGFAKISGAINGGGSMQATGAALSFIALTALWPGLHLLVFLFRFERLAPGGFSDVLVFVPMGMIAALVLLLLWGRAGSRPQKRRVALGYLLASPVAFIGSLLGGLMMPPLPGTLLFGAGPLVAGMLIGYAWARNRPA